MLYASDCECRGLHVRPLEDARHRNSRSGKETHFRQRQPHILVGVTSPQTCLVLHGRVRALRDAGFSVSLLSAPGELLEQTARTERGCLAVPMERGISSVRRLVALFRIWRLLRRFKTRHRRIQHPESGPSGNPCGVFLSIPVRIYFLRGLKLETSRGLRRFLLAVGREGCCGMRPLGGVQQPESA